jgi:hypothetical protein
MKTQIEHIMDNSANKLSSSSIISNKSLSKLPNWTVLSLTIQAILVPLVVMGNSAVVKAEEFKPKQLIAQSCQNFDVRVGNGQNRNFSPGQLSIPTCGYQFNFQSDGNLVLMKSGQVLWATGTEGRGKTLSMQSDGNLVMYDGGNKPLWATNTDGNSGAFFAIQSDGNLVVYRSDGRQALWASNTNGGQARSRNNAGEWRGGGSQPNQPSNSRWANEFNSFQQQKSGQWLADPNGYFPGECVSLVKQWGAFIGRGYGFWVGDYPAPAFYAYQGGNQSIVNNDSNTSIISDWRQLQAGDIVIMRGKSSHTGIASGKKTGSQYEMFDQNSPPRSASALQWYDGSNFIGGIRYN